MAYCMDTYLPSVFTIFYANYFTSWLVVLVSLCLISIQSWFMLTHWSASENIQILRVNMQKTLKLSKQVRANSHIYSPCRTYSICNSSVSVSWAVQNILFFMMKYIFFLRKCYSHFPNHPNFQMRGKIINFHYIEW